MVKLSNRKGEKLMKLVLLFFCAILIFLAVLIILILLSSIKLNISKVTLSNVKDGKKLNSLNKEFLIYLEIYLFGKIKIAKIKLNKKLIKKLNMQRKMENIEKDIKVIKKVKTLEIIKKLKIRIDNFNLNAEIGTGDVALTVIIVTAISTAIRNSTW